MQKNKGSSVMNYQSRECAGSPTIKSTPGISQRVTWYIGGACEEGRLASHSPNVYLVRAQIYQLALPPDYQSEEKRTGKKTAEWREGAAIGPPHTLVAWCADGVNWKVVKIKPSCHYPTLEDCLPASLGEGKKWGWLRTLQRVPPGLLPSHPCRGGHRQPFGLWETVTTKRRK